MMKDLPIVGKEYWYTRAKISYSGLSWLDKVKPTLQVVSEIRPNGDIILLDRWHRGAHYWGNLTSDEESYRDNYFADFLFETYEEAVESFNKQIGKAADFINERIETRIEKMLEMRIK